MGAHDEVDTPKLGDLLQEAHTLLTQERQQDYGDPRPNYQRAAKLAALLTDLDLTERDIYVILVCVKLSRERSLQAHDNRADAAAYIAMLDYAIQQDARADG